MEPWRCESLRLTAFWADGRDTSKFLTWETVVGSPADHYEQQPKLRFAREFGSIAENSLNLEVRSSPGRVDWLLAPIPPTSPAELGSPFRRFPILADSLDTFAHLLFERAVEAYEIDRIALGMAAVRPTANRRESYEDLARLLPEVRVPLDGASEFFFQINRPRTSKSAAAFKINRISRWMSVVSGQAIFPQTTQAVPTFSIAVDPEFATRVELDLSTPAEHQTTIQLNDRRLLLAEMLGLAKELIELGDRP